MNSNQIDCVRPELPKIVGLSHICIFVDDMEKAVAYYQNLVGVQPDLCLYLW